MTTNVRLNGQVTAEEFVACDPIGGMNCWKSRRAYLVRYKTGKQPHRRFVVIYGDIPEMVEVKSKPAMRYGTSRSVEFVVGWE